MAGYTRELAKGRDDELTQAQWKAAWLLLSKGQEERGQAMRQRMPKHALAQPRKQRRLPAQ